MINPMICAKTIAISAAFAVSLAAQAPAITVVTNAAMPQIDVPADPSIPVGLAPRSIATIFGSNLSAGTASPTPPWPSSAAGTEVHIVVNPTAYRCDPCEVTAGLLYVSPKQINFVVPDTISIVNNFAVGFHARVVLVENGVRFDNHDDVFGGFGLITIIASQTGDVAMFQVGYDCLYSYSQSDPGSCGFSTSSGNHRAVLGAITDAAGTLINSSNPLRQGEAITLWETGLAPLQPQANGLLAEKSPALVVFGISHQGIDSSTSLVSALPAFAGESPQFAGLDQINVNFPTCSTKTKATAEKQYDAFLSFGSFITGNVARVYAPFRVAVGDSDCQF